MDEDDEIVVKPSIDGIPDEYFIGESSIKIHVHLFSISNSEAKDKLNYFKETLPEDGYIFFEHSLESDNCKELLNGSKHFLLLYNISKLFFNKYFIFTNQASKTKTRHELIII